jgi:hypothetical protein
MFHVHTQELAQLLICIYFWTMYLSVLGSNLDDTIFEQNNDKHFQNLFLYLTLHLYISAQSVITSVC